MPIFILKIGFNGLWEGIERVDRQTRVGTYKLGPWCYPQSNKNKLLFIVKPFYILLR